jgi:hypothetical protein
MSRYVLDANVAVKWFVPEDLTPQAVRLLEGNHHFVVPDLLYPEAGNALWQNSGAVRSPPGRREQPSRESRTPRSRPIPHGSSHHRLWSWRSGSSARCTTAAISPSRFSRIVSLSLEIASSMDWCRARFAATCCRWRHYQPELTARGALVEQHCRVSVEMVHDARRPRRPPSRCTSGSKH